MRVCSLFQVCFLMRERRGQPEGTPACKHVKPPRPKLPAPLPHRRNPPSNCNSKALLYRQYRLRGHHWHNPARKRRGRHRRNRWCTLRLRRRDKAHRPHMRLRRHARAAPTGARPDACAQPARRTRNRSSPRTRLREPGSARKPNAQAERFGQLLPRQALQAAAHRIPAPSRADRPHAMPPLEVAHVANRAAMLRQTGSSADIRRVGQVGQRGTDAQP